MKPAHFINRERELAYLDSIGSREGRQLVILYGRRRVGKTELATHFISGKNAIYFLADKRGTRSNAERFAAICAEHFGDVRPEVKNLDDVFKYVRLRAGGKRLIVVIDEFPYLVERDESMPSVFQLVFDEILKGTNIFLILSGSSMSMMYKGTLSYESPLYGRRSGEWLLRAMPFRDIRKFYPRLPFEEMVMTYAVVGGIPAYASRFGGGGVFESIKADILTKGEHLYSEPEVLLREELREPSSYFSILEAMASATKLTDIANAARIPAKDMPKYLKVLEDLELIHRVVLVTETRSKRGLYFIKDNFFNFWFRFVYPHKSELESEHVTEVLELVKRDFNAYVGRTFEQVCMEYLEQEKPVPFSKIGRWWGHYRDEKSGQRLTEEIDVVSIDEMSKTILFAECKWQDGVDALRLLNSLKAKAARVDWHNNERKEHFAVFAKSFGGGKPRAKNCLFFDKTDLFR